MQRINQSTPETASSKGLFTEGNPLQNIPATIVTADWLNDIQENIANLIESRNLPLSPGNYNQLKLAIEDMIPFQVINISVTSPNSTTPLLRLNKTSNYHINLTVTRKNKQSNTIGIYKNDLLLYFNQNNKWTVESNPIPFSSGNISPPTISANTNNSTLLYSPTNLPEDNTESIKLTITTLN